jgi:hypothetical protein
VDEGAPTVAASVPLHPAGREALPLRLRERDVGAPDEPREPVQRWLDASCAGYLGHLFQKRALTMAQSFFFFTVYVSVGDVKVSCRICLFPDF